MHLYGLIIEHRYNIKYFIETTTLELPKDAEVYELQGKDGFIRATVMTCNGEDFVLGEGNALPDMKPVLKAAGTYEVAPATCTFIVM